jgi:Kdo2-lipid IVA lauroyltransferase/acyltransferase
MTDPSLAQPAVASLPGAVAAGRAAPRWYSHAYNRAELYRLAAAMGWLPRPARLGLARAVGRGARRLFPAERAVVRSTLEVMTGATGARLDELTVGVFRDFAMCFSDLVTTNRQPSTRLTAHVSEARGTERLDGLEGGMISLTAHVGNWEMAGRLLALRSARPTHVVVAEEEIRALERWVRRDGDGVRFVPRTMPTVSLQLVTALRRGEVVAVQGDRALGTRGDALVPFFGRPAPFPLGPFILARALRVPLVPAFCTLGPDHRYAVTVPEPLTVAAGGEEEALRAWVALLEETVRRHPTQWFNFFDIWNPIRG